VVGLAAWVWLAIMSREGEGGEDVAMGADGVGWWLVAAMLLSNISTAVADVVVDAMVAERAGASDSVEAGLQEFCWNSMFVGGEFFFWLQLATEGLTCLQGHVVMQTRVTHTHTHTHTHTSSQVRSGQP